MWVEVKVYLRHSMKVFVHITNMDCMVSRTVLILWAVGHKLKMKFNMCKR